jgi:nicotinamidase-related amidase
MALTTFDPKTALVIIDMQKGIVALRLVHPVKDILIHVSTLTDAFRWLGLPVVLVNVAGAAPGRIEQARNLNNLPDDWTELAADLNHQPTDIVVTKKTWGAFASTDLKERLKALDVTHVVIAGIATSIGVESTARQAYEAGFNVTLAIDAMTDINAEAHTNSVTHIFPRISETGTTQEIIDLLSKTRAERTP